MSTATASTATERHAAHPRTLVIIAHPDLAGSSRINRRWAAELAAHPDEFAVRDLYALYPTEHLSAADIAAERAALSAAETVVLQFPIYWYSAPALLRTWTDDVYGDGWAYGGEVAEPGQPGRALAGKTFACAVTAGDYAYNYQPTGQVGFTMGQLMAPFAATHRYVGARFASEPFALYATEHDLPDAEVDVSARAYVDWIRSL